MKRSKILTILHDKYPKAGDNKTVKVKYWNDLMDDLDEIMPSDGLAKVDAISELHPGSGVSVDGALKVNTISELTSGSGITIDGVLLKDGAISTGTARVVEKTIEVLLTSANLLAMHATPVTVVASPGTGYALNFHRAVLIYDSTATQYAGGGVITINYGSGGAACSSNLAATFLTEAGDKVWNLEKLNGAGGFTMPVNTPLVITNASAPFITGTGVCRLQITYSVHATGL